MALRKKIKFNISIFTLLFFSFSQLSLPVYMVSADEPDTTSEQSTEEENTSGENDEKSCEEEEKCPEKDLDKEALKACFEELKCKDFDSCLKDCGCKKIKECVKVEVENKNKVKIKNEVETVSNTGENKIEEEENDEEESDEEKTEQTGLTNEEDPVIKGEGEEGQKGEETEECVEECEEEAVIETGDAVAVSNVYNEANTNIYGENYKELIYNIEELYEGDIDLLKEFEELLAAGVIDPEAIEAELLKIVNENKAKVKNNVETTANTGDNEIKGEENSSIETGDATAISNTVNVINSNIIGENWLIAMINIYGEWRGDLIVPGKDLLTLSSTEEYDLIDITNENKAEVENNIETTANTGENVIKGGDESNIATGDAYADSQTLNYVNQNIIESNWFFLMINNMGHWTGQVFNPDDESGSPSFSYDFGIIENGKEIIKALIVHNTNEAKVTNNITTTANTGDNKIKKGSEAEIKTGDASAVSRVVNFINTNIIGSNWLIAIVNIMGKWEGDTVFAYPDLSISIDSNKDKVGPGENVTYTVKYENIGKADCKQTEVMVSLPAELNYSSASKSLSQNAEGLILNLPGVKSGEGGSFTVTTKVDEGVSQTLSAVESAAGIKTETSEKELGNNYATAVTGLDFTFQQAFFDNDEGHEVDKIAGDGEGNTGEGNTGEGTEEALALEDKELNSKIKITRKVKVEENENAPASVKHYIYVENTGDDTVYGIIVTDKIKNGIGKLASYQWEAGDLLKGEKVRVKYELAVNPIAGEYKSTASAYGYDDNGKKVKAKAVSQKFTINGNGIIENYGDYYYEDYIEEDKGLVPQVQAAGPEYLSGSEVGDKKMPLWIWIAAAISYLLAINWALFPKKSI